VSGQPLSHPAISRVSPYRTADAPEQARPATDEAQRAQSLLPRSVLQGCREVLQRISDQEPRSYGVTSSLRGEGRSTIAVGMALVQWLDYERRTVLVDLDLEHPTLHERFGVSDGTGLADLADGHFAMEDYLQRIAGDVWLLSAGRLREDAPRTLARLAQGTVLPQLEEWADALVFDLPPLLGSPTGPGGAKLCATPVMVVRAGLTPLPIVKRATDSLPVAPPVVLNGVRSALPAWIRRATGDWKT